jgi:sulfite exporter TauE/SafE
MKRLMLTFVLLGIVVLPAQAEDLWHDSVRACVVGGGVIGASSAMLLYSSAAAATAAGAAFPGSLVVAGNTIFGCGLGTLGTMFVYGLGSLYEGMRGEQLPEEALSDSKH